MARRAAARRGASSGDQATVPVSRADMTAPAMAVRQHILASLAAIPTALPELARAWRVLYAEIAEQGVLVHPPAGRGVPGPGHPGRAALLAGDHGLSPAPDRDAAGHGARRGSRRSAAGWRSASAGSARSPLGSLGAFLLFDWPPLLHGLIARVLLVVIVVWLTSVLLRFILAPGAERFRILPVSTASAAHWHLWLTLVVGWYTAARLTDWFLADLGLSEAVQSLLADVFSLIWLLILLLAFWRRPALKPDENPDAGARAAARTRNLLISAALVAAVAAGAARRLPAVQHRAGVRGPAALLLVITNRSVAHVLRPPGSDAAEAVPPLGRGHPGARAARGLGHRRGGAARLDLGGRRQLDGRRHHALASAARRAPCPGDPPGRRAALARAAHLDRSAAGPALGQGSPPARRRPYTAGRASARCCRSPATCCWWC